MRASMKTLFKNARDQKRFFDSMAGDYAQGNTLNIPFLENLKRISVPYIHGDVLDVGNGGLISFNIKKTKTVTISDIAEDLMKVPRTVEGGRFRPVHDSRIRKVEASVLKLPFADNSFDVVVMINVLHHLSIPSAAGSKKNAQKAFKEINRVLRDGATLFMSDNCPTFPFKIILDFGYAIWYQLLMKFGKPLPYFLSKKQITDFLKVGFNIEETINLDWSPRVYQPLFPKFSPPGWLWEFVLKNHLFIARKIKQSP